MEEQNEHKRRKLGGGKKKGKKKQKREIFCETEEKRENRKTFIITPNESMLRSRRPLTGFWRACAQRWRAETW